MLRTTVVISCLTLLPVIHGSGHVCCADEQTASDEVPPAPVTALVREFCMDCHSSGDATAGLDLESAIAAPVSGDVAAWEKVVRKLRARQMPPPDAVRPDEAAYQEVLRPLEGTLDQIAADNPHPGRTETFRRMTRTEYQNAIRDLLDLEIDAAALLPKDESSGGFDNITVGELSPTLLNRYISAAQKISRMAVGVAGRTPDGDTIRIRPDLTQDEHIPGLPFGTRGGTMIPYQFPNDGEYEVRIRLARDRNEEVEGLRGTHELEVLLDRDRVALFDVNSPPKGSKDFSSVDAHLTARFRVSAGPHELGVTFLRRSASLLETMRQPYHAHFNMHRHPRIGPAIFQVSVIGPFKSEGAGESPSRQRIFVCEPSESRSDEDCAREILGKLARRAWRRPVQEEEINGLLEFFRDGQADGDFDRGIESALAAILVSPKFLFRLEIDPADAPSGSVYALRDPELATRLSFFLWSSLPDDELLALAEQNQLSQPAVLEQQVRRMLADERSRSLVTNFAGQWLYLRNLDSVHPDMRLFPDFDHNLRDAMRQETELFFESIVRDDRSVLDILRSDDTWLNERLAKHYGIPHVYGSRFRRVELDAESHRGGLLRHGSILTVTSYATRTSPVIRGHWVLQNLVGTPPPPPPPDVPALKDNTVLASLPVRERLLQHRADANCAVCHNQMDPVGFSLENYDAIGRWRELEAGRPVDSSGGMADGSTFSGVEGLEEKLLERPELFVGTMSEKLLTYALGRGVDYRDAPTVRQIVRDAEADGFRFSSIVLGITRSTPFRMRTAK